MKHPVAAGDPCHRSRKFTVFTVFIGDFRSVKDRPDLPEFFSVICPGQLRFSSVDFDPEPYRTVLCRRPRIRHIGLHAVLHTDHRKGRCAQRIAEMGGAVPVLIAVVTAAVSGFLAIKLMLKIVKKVGMRWFAVYTFLLGAFLIAYQLLG